LELSELKMTSASNIINLRTSRGLTQAQLGEMLNYSDKTISKWERAEAIPDAYVLTKLAELFDVSVDYILSPHTAWEPVVSPKEQEEIIEVRYNKNIIILIAVMGIMTLALTVFITMWILEIPDWRVFLVGITISDLVFMILQCYFNKARYLKYIISSFVVLILIDIYCIFPEANIWQVFLLVVPALIIVFLSFRVKGSGMSIFSKKKQDKQ